MSNKTPGKHAYIQLRTTDDSTTPMSSKALPKAFARAEKRNDPYLRCRAFLMYQADLLANDFLIEGQVWYLFSQDLLTQMSKMLYGDSPKKFSRKKFSELDALVKNPSYSIIFSDLRKANLLNEGWINFVRSLTYSYTMTTESGDVADLYKIALKLDQLKALTPDNFARVRETKHWGLLLSRLEKLDQFPSDKKGLSNLFPRDEQIKGQTLLTHYFSDIKNKAYWFPTRLKKALETRSENQSFAIYDAYFRDLSKLKFRGFMKSEDFKTFAKEPLTKACEVLKSFKMLDERHFKLIEHASPEVLNMFIGVKKEQLEFMCEYADSGVFEQIKSAINWPDHPNRAMLMDIFKALYQLDPGHWDRRISIYKLAKENKAWLSNFLEAIKELNKHGVTEYFNVLCIKDLGDPLTAAKELTALKNIIIPVKLAEQCLNAIRAYPGRGLISYFSDMSRDGLLESESAAEQIAKVVSSLKDESATPLSFSHSQLQDRGLLSDELLAGFCIDRVKNYSQTNLDLLVEFRDAHLLPSSDNPFPSGLEHVNDYLDHPEKRDAINVLKRLSQADLLNKATSLQRVDIEKLLMFVESNDTHVSQWIDSVLNAFSSKLDVDIELLRGLKQANLLGIVKADVLSKMFQYNFKPSKLNALANKGLLANAPLAEFCINRLIEKSGTDLDVLKKLDEAKLLPSNQYSSPQWINRINDYLGSPPHGVIVKTLIILHGAELLDHPELKDTIDRLLKKVYQGTRHHSTPSPLEPYMEKGLLSTPELAKFCMDGLNNDIEWDLDKLVALKNAKLLPPDIMDNTWLSWILNNEWDSDKLIELKKAKLLPPDVINNEWLSWILYHYDDIELFAELKRQNILHLFFNDDIHAIINRTRIRLKMKDGEREQVVKNFATLNAAGLLQRSEVYGRLEDILMANKSEKIIECLVQLNEVHVLNDNTRREVYELYIEKVMECPMQLAELIPRYRAALTNSERLNTMLHVLMCLPSDEINNNINGLKCFDATALFCNEDTVKNENNFVRVLSHLDVLDAFFKLYPDTTLLQGQHAQRIFESIINQNDLNTFMVDPDLIDIFKAYPEEIITHQDPKRLELVIRIIKKINLPYTQDDIKWLISEPDLKRVVRCIKILESRQLIDSDGMSKLKDLLRQSDETINLLSEKKIIPLAKNTPVDVQNTKDATAAQALLSGYESTVGEVLEHATTTASTALSGFVGMFASAPKAKMTALERGVKIFVRVGIPSSETSVRWLHKHASFWFSDSLWPEWEPILGFDRTLSDVTLKRILNSGKDNAVEKIRSFVSAGYSVGMFHQKDEEKRSSPNGVDQPVSPACKTNKKS